MCLPVPGKAVQGSYCCPKHVAWINLSLYYRGNIWSKWIRPTRSNFLKFMWNVCNINGFDLCDVEKQQINYKIISGHLTKEKCAYGQYKTAVMTLVITSSIVYPVHFIDSVFLIAGNPYCVSWHLWCKIHLLRWFVSKLWKNLLDLLLSWIKTVKHLYIHIYMCVCVCVCVSVC